MSKTKNRLCLLWLLPVILTAELDVLEAFLEILSPSKSQGGSP